jgi:RHS repeat-associated protein
VTYDANGNKVEENVGGTIHEYVSAFGITAQMTGTTENATNVDLPGGVQALYSGGTLQRFRFPDWQGTIRAESDANSNDPTYRQFTESLAFAPFGERYALKGAPYNVDSFTGKPDQLVSDEYDFPAREEHNAQGRWVSPDPMRGTGNKYVYADNNPLSKVDLQGLVAVVVNGIEVADYDGYAYPGFVVPAESSPPASTQTGGQTTTTPETQTTNGGDCGFWCRLKQRFTNCFSGFCGVSDEEKAVIQKVVDTKIQNERKDLEKACPFGCLGKTLSDIKKMTPQEIDHFYDAVQFAAQFTAMIYGARGISPDWGKNRLVKELHDQGYVYEGPTNSGDGLMYKNPGTGEEVRLMPRPDRAPFSGEPSAKFENDWYYRYRSGPDQPWQDHTPVPDK